MTASKTEITIQLLRVLIGALQENVLHVSEEDTDIAVWLSSEDSRDYLIARLQQAITVLELMNTFGEYIAEYHV